LIEQESLLPQQWALSPLSQAASGARAKRRGENFRMIAATLPVE
jgi:hypothetical protein